MSERESCVCFLFAAHESSFEEQLPQLGLRLSSGSRRESTWPERVHCPHGQKGVCAGVGEPRWAVVRVRQDERVHGESRWRVRAGIRWGPVGGMWMRVFRRR